MEYGRLHLHPWFSAHLLYANQLSLQNYVHWAQTPESHVFSVDLPGLKKEEIKIEIEDSKYMIIRTERIDESTPPRRSFLRKFRLPVNSEIDAISATFEDGILAVSVPRSDRRGFFIEPADIPERIEVMARAA